MPSSGSKITDVSIMKYLALLLLLRYVSTLNKRTLGFLALSAFGSLRCARLPKGQRQGRSLR